MVLEVTLGLFGISWGEHVVLRLSLNSPGGMKEVSTADQAFHLSQFPVCKAACYGREKASLKIVRALFLCEIS